MRYEMHDLDGQGSGRYAAEMKQHWSEILVAAHACEEAIVYARQYRSFEAAWTACTEPEWMLWWLGLTVPDTSEHRQTLATIAIRIVMMRPGRDPIPVWDQWATAYLRRPDTTGAIAAAEAAWTGGYRWAWEAALSAEAPNVARPAVRAMRGLDPIPLGPEEIAQAARVADIIREHYPTPMILI